VANPVVVHGDGTKTQEMDFCAMSGVRMIIVDYSLIEMQTQKRLPQVLISDVESKKANGFEC
jgi:hypothetical protein